MDGEFDLNLFRRRLLKRGERANARVLTAEVAKWQSEGTTLTHKYLVEVQPEGAAPFQAELKDAFSLFWAPKRGDLVPVRYHPKSHKVAFDLDGDPRYDASLQQQTGRWTPGEAPPPSIFANAPRPADTASRLQKLAELRDSGLITADEFDEQKARILSSI
jgi:hypothetical protein